MLGKKVKRFIEENERTAVVIGTFVIVMGGYVGYKYFKGFKPVMVPTRGDVSVLVKELNPTFPIDMSITDIKQALDGVEGAQYADALVTLVDGTKTLYVR